MKQVKKYFKINKKKLLNHLKKSLTYDKISKTSSGPLKKFNEHFVENLKKGDKSNGKHHRSN